VTVTAKMRTSIFTALGAATSVLTSNLIIRSPNARRSRLSYLKSSEAGVDYAPSVAVDGPDDPDCAPQALGNAPPTNNPDNVDAFLNNTLYRNMSLAASTPKGWERAFVGEPGEPVDKSYLVRNSSCFTLAP
jgi:hypothetical protein